MSKRYRSFEERCDIVRAIIAESAAATVSSYGLSESEDIYYRARAHKAVEALGREASHFRAYYSLPAKRPFNLIVAMSALVVAGASVAGVVLWIHTRQNPAYPMFAALLTVSAVALGWAITGWITHRNTVRQNTNNIIFARFSHGPFGEAMHLFHKAFGYDPQALVSREQMMALRETGKDEDFKASVSVTYLLNYFEFIASGVLRGDLDATIVRDNIRSVINYYHDKCWPYINFMRGLNPRIFENLIKLRTHYREP
jgi:hypothetical protein